MKKAICILLLSAMVLSMLAGCRKTEEQKSEGLTSPVELAETTGATQPRGPAPELDLFEENTVDDSFSFTYVRQEKYPFMKAYLDAEVFPAYVKTWTEDGQLLESDISGCSLPEGGDQIWGWVLFRGIPKGETGWKSVDGKDLYCRVFTGSSADKENYVLEKTQAGVPVKRLNAMTLYGSVLPEFGIGKTKDGERSQEPSEFPGLDLQRAELYVRSLEKSFVLEDSQSLKTLAGALAPSQRHHFYDSSYRFLNPLLLTLADGTKLLVNTPETGAPQTDVWGGQSMPVNLFSLFGVPLDAEGYSTDTQGNTVIQEGGKSEVYTPDGRILSIQEMREMEDGKLHSIEFQYSYRPDGQLEKQVTYDDGQPVFETVYEYDERNLLIKECSSHTGEVGAFYTYEYDDQDRLMAKIFHKPDGSLGHNTSNTYYWYDEEGNRHHYSMLDDGTVNGGDAPETPVRRGE